MTTEHLFCWCGYPITVEDVPTVEGERQVYSDGRTGRVIMGIQACPGCLDWPLDVSRLFAEPAPIGQLTEHLPDLSVGLSV